MASSAISSDDRIANAAYYRENNMPNPEADEDHTSMATNDRIANNEWRLQKEAILDIESDGVVRLRKEFVAVKRVKPKRRHKSGAKALKEIKQEQKKVTSPFAHAPFCRLVKEIIQEKFQGLMVAKLAIEALKECVADYCIQTLSDAQLAAIHGGRVTITKRDMGLVERMAKEALGKTPMKY